jgi:hypothetical protein
LALQIKLCLTSNETKEIPIRDRKKQDGNNSLGEILHSKMQEEHGKKLRRRRNYGKTETGGGYSIGSNKLHNH